MKEWLLGGLADLFGLMLNLTVPLLVRVREKKGGRARMAHVYRLLRQAEQADYADAVRSRYAIHPSVCWGRNTWIGGAGEIEIGEGTYLGANCFVVSDPKQAKIQIGKLCAISHNVHVRTAGYDTDIPFGQARNAQPVSGDIQIGDFVWLGANVIVLGGVHIGNNSIIGANSVVTQDVQADCIYGGVPARLIRRKAESAGMDSQS